MGAMIYGSGSDYLAAPRKRVLLFGMSGLGKTYLANLMRAAGGGGSTTRSITGSAPAIWANSSPTISSARR